MLSCVVPFIRKLQGDSVPWARGMPEMLFPMRNTVSFPHLLNHQCCTYHRQFYAMIVHTKNVISPRSDDPKILSLVVAPYESLSSISEREVIETIITLVIG
jgi:hypothetical protein